MHYYLAMKFKTACTYFYCFILLFFTACISQTRHQNQHPCYAALQPGDKVLIDKIQGLDEQESYRLYQYAARVLSKQGIQAYYVQEEEYNMARLGIKNLDDSTRYPLLKDSLGIEHLLKIRLSTSSKGGLYETWTKEELQQPYLQKMREEEDPERKASLSFWLKAIKNKQSVPPYLLHTTTKMSSVSLTKQNGNTTDYNLSSTGMATYKALKKGLRKLISACDG